MFGAADNDLKELKSWLETGILEQAEYEEQIEGVIAKLPQADTLQDCRPLLLALKKWSEDGLITAQIAKAAKTAALANVSSSLGPMQRLGSGSDSVPTASSASRVRSCASPSWTSMESACDLTSPQQETSSQISESRGSSVSAGDAGSRKRKAGMDADAVEWEEDAGGRDGLPDPVPDNRSVGSSSKSSSTKWLTAEIQEEQKGKSQVTLSAFYGLPTKISLERITTSDGKVRKVATVKGTVQVPRKPKQVLSGMGSCAMGSWVAGECFTLELVRPTTSASVLAPANVGCIETLLRQPMTLMRP